ncbi:hypothetical protein [Mesoplasma coleopterae]|uniref:Transmembrane protein n=1 Tax=Mesoplasma coleopterae TaxID=324078 RepID=A0A2K8P2V9_9MOLU|nr:hypothetical protein [Mesoplasma coleopterae]ATZ21082.1 hypothetical protein MCOLE_v1c05710 [Mesoplasma coleopterae]AVN63242.1 hypothetical protein CG000_03015 [Mesoplasma coleopterae]
MDSLFVINLMLLIVNFIVMISLLFSVLYFNRAYINYQVPRINSYNDVISSKEIERIIEQFKRIYNLADYEIIYASTENYINLFRNLNKNKKQIVISKKIFESVGYEIDYIISRLWIASKINEKNGLVRGYKWLLVTIPFLSLALMCICLLMNCVLFGYMSGRTNENTDKIILWVWKIPMFSILFFIGLISMIISYLFSFKVKETIEYNYSNEISSLVKIALEEYVQDFVSARTYAQNIKISYLPLIKNSDFWENSKWVGPFVYM